MINVPIIINTIRIRGASLLTPEPDARHVETSAGHEDRKWNCGSRAVYPGEAEDIETEPMQSRGLSGPPLRQFAVPRLVQLLPGGTGGCFVGIQKFLQPGYRFIGSRLPLADRRRVDELKDARFQRRLQLSPR